MTNVAKDRRKFIDRQFAAAARYAEFYFDPAEQARMLEESGRPVDADYAVLVVNRFVPIDWVPGSGAVLRKFVRGSASALDAGEGQTLHAYWRELERTAKALSDAFEAGEPTSLVRATARGEQTWPAVGVAASEGEMRSLLVEQLVVIRQSGVAWQCVDSSTYSRPKPDGIYVLVDFMWHGG